MKNHLVERIDGERDALLAFLREFVRCRTPNPPGDTTAAAGFLERWFSANGIAYEKIAPRADCPNYIATLDTGRPGPHLVLNGHIDVFPVESTTGWTKDPWGAELVDGRVYGRGTCDMKCGTTASLHAFLYLRAVREQLNGRLTLTVVSDEETFGPWGMTYLMDRHRDQVLGDCCLNGEPSSPWTVRFGEKGPLWLRFRTRARGGHGAFPHVSRNAVLVAVDVIQELRALPDRIPLNEDPELARALDEAQPELERGYGAGAAKVIRSLTVGVGRMQGGVKVNMIPAECEFDVDIRIPNGADPEAVKREVAAIAGRHPEVTYEVLTHTVPNWCEPYHEMMDHVRENARALKGIVPARVVSPGGTDARLWRVNGVPAVVYGPSPHGMGAADEYVSVDEFIHVVKCHALSAYDYLSRKR